MANQVMRLLDRWDRFVGHLLGIESGPEDKRLPVKPPLKREMPGNKRRDELQKELEQLRKDYDALDIQCRQFRDDATSCRNKLDMAEVTIRELRENHADNRKTEMDVYADLAEQLELLPQIIPVLPKQGLEYQTHSGHGSPVVIDRKDKVAIGLHFLAFKQELEMRAKSLAEWNQRLLQQRQKLIEMAASQRLRLE